MRYQTFIPTDILKPYIKYFWVLEDEVKPVPTDPERILPDGCLELLFNLSDPFFRIYPDNTSEIMPLNCIHGQIKNYIHIQPSGKTNILGARFFPTGLSPFIQLPLSLLNGSATSLENIFGSRIKSLEEQLITETDTIRQINLIENFLVKKLLAGSPIDYTVERCIHLIVKARGQVFIPGLSKKINISERHLERKFASLVGLSPKSFQRVVRFQQVLTAMRQENHDKLSSIAFEHGYYDQAHFSKDFREFTGVNPRTYLAFENTVSDFSSSDNLFQAAS